jgi:hypothetical protein
MFLILSTGVLLLQEYTVAHCFTNSNIRGFHTKLLCHTIVTIFHLTLYKLYSCNIFITAFGVAGTKSIKSIDDSPVSIHHIPSISLSGAIVESILALYS